MKRFVLTRPSVLKGNFHTSAIQQVIDSEGKYTQDTAEGTFADGASQLQAALNMKKKEEYVPKTRKPIRTRTKKEVMNGFEQWPNPYFSRYFDPKVNPIKPNQKITLTVASENECIVRLKKCDMIELETLEDGFTVITPCMEPKFYTIPPQVFLVHWGEEEKEMWYTAGGYMTLFFYGPVHFNGFYTVRLEDLDPELVEKELELAREKAKHKTESVRELAKMTVSQYEQILEGFELKDELENAW